MSDLIHGIEVLELDTGVRPVSTVRTSVIGLVGTSPKGPVNTPVLLTGPLVARETFGTVGTLADALTAIYAQAGALVVAVNVLDPANAGHVETVADEDLGTPAQNAVVSLENPWVTEITSLTQDPGDGDIALTLGTDYTVEEDPETGITRITVLKDLSGDALEAAYKHLDLTAPDADDAAGTALNGKGVYALLGAESITGVAPRILVCPGFNHFATSPSVAVTTVPPALLAVASRLRAVAILDGPSTTMADAIAAEALVSGERSRGLLVDPWVDVSGVSMPASAYVAGLGSRSDNEHGFWRSWSNQPISGITGTARPVDFSLGDPASEADVLNGAHIATIINRNGFRLWGNRSLEKSDPKWKFLSVRRIADMINESLMRAHLWAVDRNITKTYVEEVVAGIESYLRQLQAQGAILGGSVWADPELNTPESIADGQVWFDFDFTPAYPAEKITFRSRLVNDYVETIFN